MSNRKSKKNKSALPPADQNWFEGTTSKITTIGGAILILTSVGAAAYQVGSTFKDNEKKIEIFDLKVEHQREKDSLISQLKKAQDEVNILKKRKPNEKK